jgi:hypothetical protein
VVVAPVVVVALLVVEMMVVVVAAIAEVGVVRGVATDATELVSDAGEARDVSDTVSAADGARTREMLGAAKATATATAAIEPTATRIFPTLPYRR